MALPLGLPQAVVAVDIGLRGCLQCQRLRRIDFGVIGPFAIHQPVEQVQDVSLGWHASFKRQLDSAHDGIFVMVKHQGQDIDHFPVPTFLARAM